MAQGGKPYIQDEATLDKIKLESNGLKYSPMGTQVWLSLGGVFLDKRMTSCSPPLCDTLKKLISSSAHV